MKEARDGRRSQIVERAPGPAVDLQRLRRRAWWNLVGVVYALGVLAVAQVLFSGPPLPTTVVAVLATAAGVAASVRMLAYRFAATLDAGPQVDQHAPGRLVVVAVVAAAIYVVAMLLVDRLDPTAPTSWLDRRTTWFTVPGIVTGAVAVATSRWRRVVVVLVGAAIATLLAGVTQFVLIDAVAWPWLGTEGAMTALVGGVMVYGHQEWDLTVRRDQHYRLEAQLAVADERLRFAADLHDIQGHHLHVIAFESELAARLAETDPTAAAGHMAEVHEHARTALADTREVVQGYRQTPLGEELTNATRVLEAAGIDGRLDPGAVDGARALPGPGRELLGLVVREATTNILRHSHARRARLTLDVDVADALLVIRNDGATVANDRPGTGLAGLEQRLEAVGGALRWEHDDGWFTLTAHVPVAERPA